MPAWWIERGTLIFDNSLSAPPEQEGKRQAATTRDDADETPRADDNDREIVCDRFGVVAKACRSCAGVGCTEAIRTRLRAAYGADYCPDHEIVDGVVVRRKRTE